jgi:hypothetical protein
MPTEIIGMYGAVTGGTQDGLANIDIPQDGVITGVDWDGRGDLDADTEFWAAELSFIATNQLTQNDVRGRISSVSSGISLTTSGAPAPVLQKFVGPLDLPVSGGERLYLHASSTSGVGGEVRCNIHLDVGRSGTRRSARR